MAKYRKKPVVVEAFQYDGDFKGSNGYFYVPRWAEDALNNGTLYYDENEPWELFVKTLEGAMHVSVNDYLILGINKEIYPCKPDIFEKTYDMAE